MPNIIVDSKVTIPKVDIDEDANNVPLLPNDPILIEVEKTTGLRITGGSDFDMPITIFHVNAEFTHKIFKEIIIFADFR